VPFTTETSKTQNQQSSDFEKKPVLMRLITFLINPTPNTPRDHSTETKRRKFPSKAWDFIRIFVLQYGLAIILGTVAVMVLSFFKYDQNDHDLTQLINNGDILFLVIYASIIAPLLEELLFRGALKLSYSRLAISISLIILFALSTAKEYFPKIFDLLPQNLFIRNDLLALPIYLGSAILLTIIIYLLLRAIIPKTKMISGYNSKTFKLMYYGTSLLFGLVHIMNYQNIGHLWFLTLILVSPQILIGLFLGFTRVQYGLSWSILNHALHNFISTIPIIILSVSSGNITLFYEKLENPDFILENLTTSEAFGLSGLACLVVLGFFIVSALTLQMIIESVVYLINKDKNV